MVVRSWPATAAVVVVGLVMAGMMMTAAMMLVARPTAMTVRRWRSRTAGDADGVFEELVAEGGEGGGDEDGEGDGGEGGGVEGAGDDQDDGPVPQVGAVGDLAEVDDGVAGQDPAGGAAVGGFEGGDAGRR